MGIRIDARRGELLATIAAIKNVDRNVRKQIRQRTKSIAGPAWQHEVDTRATTKLERRVIAATAVVNVSDQNVRLQAAGKGALLRGGLDPKIDYAGVEFGSHAHGETYSRRSKRRGRHKVTRVMGTQFRPFTSRGYVFYPAAERTTKRIASLWAQTTVRTIAEALEGKES